MGVMDILGEHPDTKNFLPRQFEQGQVFDLVLDPSFMSAFL
jgi:hypothetical protein